MDIWLVYDLMWSAGCASVLSIRMNESLRNIYICIDA